MGAALEIEGECKAISLVISSLLQSNSVGGF